MHNVEDARTRTTAVAHGTWWRFDRYEVRNGYIQPARGATLQPYDPLELERAHRGGKTDPPHLSLFNLLAETNLIMGPEGPELSAEGKSLICNWCAEYGLLGVLPHRVQMVTLPAKWEEFVGGLTWEERAKGWKRRSALAPIQWRFVRGPTKWIDIQTPLQLKTGEYSDEGQRHRPGEIVDVSLLQEPCEVAHVLIDSDFPAGLWKREPLGATWAKFFPKAARSTKPPEETAYFPPLSVPFWQDYAEPVDVFLRTAATLRDAVLKAAQVPPESERQQVAQFRGARDRLEGFLGSVNPTLVTNGNSLEQRWSGQSLLGVIAMMAVQDLVSNRRLLMCQARRCKKMFLSAAYQARYCSEPCRWWAQKYALRHPEGQVGRQQPGRKKARHRR